MEPLARSTESPVSSAAGLVLQSAACDLDECPFLNEWRAGVVTYAAEQARRFVPTTRTWSNSTFVAGAVASIPAAAAGPLQRHDCECHRPVQCRVPVPVAPAAVPDAG